MGKGFTNFIYFKDSRLISLPNVNFSIQKQASTIIYAIFVGCNIAIMTNKATFFTFLLPARLVMFLLFMLAGGAMLNAQDPIFSLFRTSPMNYNPAHIGNTEFTRASIGYRNQHPTYSKAFSTTAASFDTYIHNLNSGFGIMVLNDNMMGKYKETDISLGYSYNAKLSSNAFLRAGLQATYRMQSNNPGDLIFPDMIDISGAIIPNAFPYTSWNAQTFDVSLGLAFMYKNLKLGAAAFNLSGKQSSAYNGIELPNPLRLTAYATYDILLAKGSSKYEESFWGDFSRVSASPHIQYSRQYDFDLLSLGVYFNVGNIFVGLHQKQDISFKAYTYSFSTGIDMGRISVSASGDIAQLGSPTNSLHASAFEVGLTFRLWQNKEPDEQTLIHREKRRKFKMLNGIFIDGKNNRRTTKQYRCPY